jgi:hypothetical protein
LEAELGIDLMDKTMQAKGKNMNVYQLDKQSEVLKTAAENLGEMGNVNLGGGGGLNPIGLMVGMGVGGAMGNQMGGMMGNINQPVPPPPPVVQYFIALNGQQSGPFTIPQLQQFIQSGQFTKNHHVWKQGMTEWELAEKNQDTSLLFSAVPPPPPVS